MKGLFSIGGLVLQFFPLAVFLKVAFLNDMPQAAEWLNAFIWGGFTAIFQLMLSSFLSRGCPLNRIILGVNLYLILGCVSILANQITLLEMFNNLRESGIFLCILIVGISTTTLSKSGFVGVVETPVRRDIRRYSMWLIIFTCFALAASFWFKGQMIISAAVPLIVLNVAARFFKGRLQHGQDEI